MALLVAPTAFDTVEIGQGVQSNEPASAANVPATHKLHWELPTNCENWPGGHRAHAVAWLVRPLPSP